jgi:hypothetical protein
VSVPQEERRIVVFAPLGVVSVKPAVVKLPLDVEVAAAPEDVAAGEDVAATLVLAAALLAMLEATGLLAAVVAAVAVEDEPVVTAAPPQALSASAAEALSRPATNRRRGREWARPEIAMLRSFPHTCSHEPTDAPQCASGEQLRQGATEPRSPVRLLERREWS